MSNNIKGRAIGQIGAGDMKKLEAAGLTVVDTAAHRALLDKVEQLKAALELAVEHIGEDMHYVSHEDEKAILLPLGRVPKADRLRAEREEHCNGA